MIRKENEDNSILYSGEYKTLQDFFNIAMDRNIPPILNIKQNSVSLNIGGGRKLIENSHLLQLPEWNAETDKIPFACDSVDVIHAYHFFEHIENIPFVLSECQRVLRVGGHINILVPYFKGGMAYQDLDHKRFYTEDTWRILFNNNYYLSNKLLNGKIIEWRFRIHLNLIMGLNQKDLGLFTQLQKI